MFANPIIPPHNNQETLKTIERESASSDVRNLHSVTIDSNGSLNDWILNEKLINILASLFASERNSGESCLRLGRRNEINKYAKICSI